MYHLESTILKYNYLNSFPSWEGVQNKANEWTVPPWPADSFIKPVTSNAHSKQNPFMEGQADATFAKGGERH